MPVKPSHRAALADELGWDYGRLTTGEAAGKIAGKLSNRGFRESHFADEFQVPATPQETRAARILSARFSDVLSLDEQAKFARTWAESEYGQCSTRIPDAEVVNRIADQLVIQRKIPSDDPRRTERPPIVTPETGEETRRSFVK